MDVRDLNILDWVLWDNTPCQVAAIGCDYIETTKCGITLAESHLLKPIPLTPEILEKNGLEIDKYKGGFFPACFKEDENYDVEIEMKGEEIAWSINCGEYWIKRLNYVHELQHALRLCGINKEIEI